MLWAHVAQQKTAFFYCAAACNATYGIAKAFLSVRPSVCLSNAWTVTKRKKLVPTFLYHMKERLF